MSLLKEFNITNELMAKYSPLGQLSSKYLAQILKKCNVLTFEEDEKIFEKKHTLYTLYFLLEGKLKIKTGLFSSETLDASSSECFNSINSKIPDGVSVKAIEKGYMIMIDETLLDRTLGWSEAEKDKLSGSLHTKPFVPPDMDTVQPQKKEPIIEKIESFDEDHFTWLTSLMEFPLFFNLPPSNMEQLLNKFHKVRVSVDEVIINEGDEGDYFYLLMEGCARVIFGGDETRPIRINRGSYFGEEALISDTVRSATVIMDENGLLARLDKASFQSLLNDPLVSHVSKQQFKEETQDSSPYEQLDIRSFSEFEHTPLPKCLHIPLSELRQKIPSLDKSKVYYLTEEGGHRSDVAAHILCQNSVQAKVIRS